MSADSAVTIAWDLLKWPVTKIKRAIKYVMSPKSFAEGLQEEVQNLENEVHRVNILVVQAACNVRNFHVVFTAWKENSDGALKEAQHLLGDFEKATDARCYGTFPDPKCRYQFSKKADRKIAVIRKLAEKCSGFKELDDISFSNPASGNVTGPNRARREGKDVVRSTTATTSVFSASTSIKLRDDDIFESRAQIMQDIKDALADNSNSVVGVHGMGGLGKSTLLEQVKSIISKEKSFDWVAKADVSQNPDIERIQKELADALGLTGIKEKESVSGRADLLRERLEEEERNKKKVLIILDNLWEGLDLKKIGIPCRHDNKVMGCKLLLTSRHLEVLQSGMGCDKDFPLGVLKKEEAKRLFGKTVGDKFHDDDFKPLVEEAVDKCAGVPFLIVALAKRFKNAGLPEWKDTLNKIKKSKNKKINDLIDDMLQWSYDKLEEEVKSLLRLCVVYGISAPSLENLVRYGVGLELFREVSSMEDARNRLSSHIRTLQASSLLLDSEDVDGFRIHDLVREFVASISLKDDPLLVLKDKSEIELLKDKPNSYVAICFPYVDMEELPQELDCSELRIFLLFTNDGSLQVSDSLFNSMSKLMVLNLTGMHLTGSPLLPKFLKNLHTLCLDDCSLEDVAILGELKGLQILSFVNSEIQRLPIEIGQLVELRLLDLSDCSSLQIIEPGVLGRLIKMEELYMGYSFDQWNVAEQTPPTNACLIELNQMKNLCTLHISIPEPSMLPGDLNVEKLTKYKIQIGDNWFRSKHEGSRTLELNLDPISDVLRKGCIQSILSNTGNLLLDGLNETDKSICALSLEGFPKLKHLQVKNSPSVHYILRWPSLIAFKTLDSLLLENLINLEEISYGHICSSKSFSTLKVIRVERCDKMEVLFPLSLLRGLSQLEEIKVVSCKLMRAIVEADDCGKVELHKLRVLELRDLPCIKNFFNAGSAPSSSISDNQVSIEIAFFNGQQVVFPNLETLAISGLDNLGFLSSPSMVQSLTQLRKLWVSNCKKMEAIIMEEEGFGVETSKTLALPMLTDLCLQSLGSLTCFSREKCSRESRSQDHVISCSTALFNQEVAFPNLETLHITGLDNIEMIWDNQVAAESFPKLKSLRVHTCNKLVNIVPSCILGWLRSLESLKAELCGSLEVVFQLQPLNPPDGHPVAHLQLKELTVSELPKLKCAWDKELHRQVKFQCLRSVTVLKCKSLTSLLPASDLTQLEELKVCGCGIEELIKKEEGLVPRFVFPNLTSLELNHMTELKCLYTGTHTSHWPALKTLKVVGCNKVEVLASQRENEMPLDKQPLFLIEKVAFPSLETLDINGMDNIEIIWDNQGAAESFPKLKSLSVHTCNKLVSIAPSCILGRLRSLESLKAELCGSLEDVFQLQPLNPPDRHPVAHLPLQELTVSELPKLKCIWDKELHRQVKFQRLRSVTVLKCKSLTSLFPASVVTDLTQLEELEVRECGLVELIEKEEGLVPGFVFPKLTSLKLEDLTELKCTYTGKHTSDWPALKTLEVCGCNKVEVLASQLENEMPLNKQPLFLIEKVAYRRLETLEIYDLDNLEFMFVPSMVKSLAHLRKLSIGHCKKMEAVIMEEEGLGTEVSETPAFLMLTDLHLEHLESLTCFSLRKCSRKDRSQDHVISHSTALFDQEVDFPCLEILQITGLDNIMMIWENQVAADSFPKLKSLCVDKCNRLVNVVPLSILGRVLSLESLTVQACDSLEVIFKLQPLNLPEGHPVACSLLKELNLKYLPKLKCLWDKELHHQVKFQYLGFVSISQCKSLTSLFPTSVARDLVELTKLRIGKCGTLTKVISGEGGREEHVVAFDQLKYIELDGLTDLRCFSSGGYTLRFPLLEDVIVTECLNMKSFSDGPIVAPKLTRVRVSTDAVAVQFWKENLNITIQNMFVEKGMLAGVKFMRLFEFPELIDKWHSELNPIKSSWKLQRLLVDKCPLFINAIPSKLMLVLANMTSLQVHDCESLEEIFNLEGLEGAESTKVLPRLNQLELVNLPKLRQLWKKDFQGTMCFNSLHSLTLHNCGNLRHVFTPSMARCLARLAFIKIKECGQMEGVIAEEEGQESAMEQITFPNLKGINLECLDNLTSFLSGKNHSLDCPTMMCLTIAHCPKMRSLTWQSSIDIDHSNPLFTPQVNFPCLEILQITDLDNIVMIWEDQVAADSFRKLKLLCVDKCNRLVNIVPSSILGRVLSLESLTVEACDSLEVIFKLQPLNSPDGHLVASLLKELKLNYLPKLKYVWDKELHHQVKFQYLCSVSISQCESLTSLFPTLIARDLVELTKLRIGKCETMTEVISDEESREEHVVAFDQLKYIELDGLTELRCFGSVGYTLRFPLLEDVIVTECLSMKSFSEGPIEAPKLKRVRLSRDAMTVQFWKENLNITIQNMFEEKGKIVGVKFLRLSEFPNLIGKWQSKLNPIKSSWQLKRPMVDKYPSFSNAIPSKLMLVSKKMTSLQMCNYGSLEEIFDLEALEAVEITEVLPNLDQLDLVNLPKLRQLWSKDLQGTMRFNSLFSLTFHNCNNLRHAFTSSIARCLANLNGMEIKECVQMEGAIAEEEGQGSTMKEITFPNLYWVKLENLPNLTSFLLGKNHTLECPKLEELTVAHCPKMRSLTWQSLMEIDGSTPALFTPQVQFPQLEWIDLSHMDNLSKIWTDSRQEALTFDCLWKVEVQNCKSLENLFPHWVATSLTQLEKLRVESCGIEEIVASGNDTQHSDTAQDLFSKLKSLVLHDMPRLKSFCPNLSTLNWPFLEELRVTHCDEVNMLSFAASLNKWTQTNDQQDLSNQEARSSFDRDFPNLERLLLVNKNIQMIRDGKFPDDIFSKPKALTLACFHDDNAVFPSIFLLERFKNVESLEVFCSSFEDIFPDEGLVDEEKHPVLENLRELKLSKLCKLKHVWREDFLVAKILRSIQTFEVWDCPCLTTIFPTVTSFQNLTKLVVKNSSGLVHLVTVSAVTKLVHLAHMTIIGCEGMKEVVANDEDEEGKVISLEKLEWLTLQHLPSLECFSSTTSCGFGFPSLRGIEVEECPKMKIFSNSTLSTPGWIFVKLFGYEWNGECDLNKTIQELSA